MQVVHGNFHHAAAQLGELISEAGSFDMFSDEYVLERSQFLYYFSESVDAK